MIDKKSHPAVRRLRDCRDRPDPSSPLFVEGVTLAEELLASPLRPREFYFSDGLKKGKALLPRLEDKGAAGSALTEEVMAFVSDLDSPPGLIVLADRPAGAAEAAVKAAAVPLVVVLCGAQSPANAGAVVRAAEAAGAHAVLQSSGGADLLGPKALRASAGSAFRLPLGGGRSPAEWAEFLSRMGLQCVAADAAGTSTHDAFDWRRPAALFLGAESGFPEGTPAGMPAVRIPLRAPVESLNVAVAAGVLLFEAARQRAASPPWSSPASTG